MFNTTYNLIKRLAISRNIWMLAGLTLALSIAMLVIRIPDGLAQWMGYRGSQGMFAPDAAAFAPAGTAYTTLALYGEEGRKVYFYNSVLFDIVYPLSYSLFLSTGLTALLSRLLPSNHPWQKISLLPLLAGGFDLLENLSIYILIANYPQHLPWLDTLTAVLTTAKGLLEYGAYLVLLVVWGWWLIRSRLSRSQPSKQPVK